MMFTLRSELFRPALRVAIGAATMFGLLGTGAPLAAQTPPTVFFACYVPLTGTVYRIKETNLKPSCTAGHIEFSWTDGAGAVRPTDPLGGDLTGVLSNANVVKLLGRALSTTAPVAGQVLSWNGTAWVPTTPASGGGVADHGALTGLGDDDHPQYLLVNGVRNSTGFAVTGTVGTGSIPTSGAGTRLMWYPGRAAFRAGLVDGDEWDDAYVGLGSTALGVRTRATGPSSTAIGRHAVATGDGSTALGVATTAAGNTSTAMGGFTFATGAFSTAMGWRTDASGDYTTAMGANVSTNGMTGSFVFGDISGGEIGQFISVTRPNQFVVRAQHFWLGTNNSVSNPAGHFLTTSTGAFLSTGGAWTNSSDVALKDGFEDVSAEDVLDKIATMPIRRWSYKAEGPSIRHFGPTAQDFRAAFGLGSAATSIATVDADGVSLLGIQALAKRTRDLERENHALRAAETKLNAANTALLARLERLEAALKRLEGHDLKSPFEVTIRRDQQ